MNETERKLRSLHKALHHLDDMNRLHVKNTPVLRSELMYQHKISRITLKRAKRKNNYNRNVNRKTKQIRKQKRVEKQLYWYFKWFTVEIAHKNTWTWLRKGNLKRETKSLLITAEKSIRTNYFKVKKL